MSSSSSPWQNNLEERIRYYEDINRFTIEALELAVSLGDFQMSINKLSEPHMILRETRFRILQLIPFESSAFYLVDEETSDFVLADIEVKNGENTDLFKKEVNYFIDLGVFAWALRERRAITVFTRDYGKKVVFHAMATSSRMRGMFVGFLDPRGKAVHDVSLTLLALILLNSSNALESFELYRLIRDINVNLEKTVHERTKQLEHQALHDSLTGLPNRKLILTKLDCEIAESRHNGGQIAFLLLDLDRFKEINDTLGHTFGDHLLIEVGRRLKESVRSMDVVARLGGDEFGVLLPRITSEINVIDVVRRIISTTEIPFFVENQYINVDMSIGIAVCPEHGLDSKTLMRKADVAMYAAKHTKTGFAVYDRGRDKSSLKKVTLLGQLRKAMESDELFLLYQPKMDIMKGIICGAEALVRWNHPSQGPISPAIFIPLAEQGGIIHTFSLKVIIMALFQNKLWQKNGCHVPIAVNLSVRNLQDPDFPEKVASAAEELGLNPGLLEFEITESAIMTNPARAISILDKFRRMGITLSIDDFGTGYSSFTYLKKLPVQTIKIDIEFVINMLRNESDAIIVKSIIDLGHNLGLKVIAEGVESFDILDTLKKMECDMAQGYYISRPIPAERFKSLFSGHSQPLLLNSDVPPISETHRTA